MLRALTEPDQQRPSRKFSEEPNAAIDGIFVNGPPTTFHGHLHYCNPSP